jgi:tetratricopeptide (TPR) repeat protein
LEVNEGSASALSARGLLLSALGDKERAFGDIDMALELDPNNGMLCNNIAWHFATHFSDDPELTKRAVELAEKAALLKPGATTWNTLGVARYRVEDFEGSIESLEKAEELSPGQYSAHNGLFLAMAHARLGQKAEAQQWYEKAVAWIDAHDADVELQRFRSEADQLLESLDMLPLSSGERRKGQTGEEDTRADQPDRSSEPVLETAGADPS